MTNTSISLAQLVFDSQLVSITVEVYKSISWSVTVRLRLGNAALGVFEPYVSLKLLQDIELKKITWNLR